MPNKENVFSLDDRYAMTNDALDESSEPFVINSLRRRRRRPSSSPIDESHPTFSRVSSLLLSKISAPIKRQDAYWL
jgi:hypothetical protein